MTDVLERLRDANPEPSPQTPAIDGVWRHIAQQPATPRRTRPTLAAGMRWLLPAGSAVVALVVAGLAVALLAHGRRPNPPQSTGVRALETQFSVLGSGKPPSAATQAMLAQTLSANQRYHPLPALARHVQSSNHTRAYLVPATHGLCVASASPIRSFCAPTGNIAGAAVADLCSPTLPAGNLQMAWLLPDRSTDITVQTTTGTLIRFPTAYNVYIANFATSNSIPESIRWTDPAGHTHSQPAPVPPNAAGQRCAHPQPGHATPSLPRPHAPHALFAYCVNSITHKRTSCSPSTASQP